MDTLFFIFSKLVGLSLQVETWLAVALAFAAVASLLSRKRLSASLSVATFLAVTLISTFPIGEALLAPLEAEYATRNIPEQVDGIVVLGGAESPRKTLRWNQPQLNDASERLIAAASLAITHPEARIVYAGGSGRLLDNVAGRGPLPPIAIDVLSIRLDQAVFFTQFRSALTSAFAVSISFLMTATMATFAGFPAARSAEYFALRSGLKRMATRAGM